MSYIPAELIKKKKNGESHTEDEIRWIIRAYTNNELPDYQMAAWAMAVWFRGMNEHEISVFTAAMRDSGNRFDFSKLKSPRIDKHSTGGVGDKTSLIIGPILAAAKVHVPMIAGRGLGHSGGTLDKLESISGFRVNLTREEFQKSVEENYFALMGQTHDICPADRKLYALRDVTSTVDSLPLICGSIMSKKLSEDLTGLVMDVKFGSGAFMKSLADAQALSQLLKTTGEKNGIDVTVVISNMNEPLGRFSGNSVEVQECIDILSNKTFVEHDFDFYEPTRRLSVELAGHMLYLAKKCDSPAEGASLAESLVQSGAALTEFKLFLQRQGGDWQAELPRAQHSDVVVAAKSGILQSINTELVGLAGIELGAGRKKSEDKIDHTAGIETCRRVGMRVTKGDIIFNVFANSTAGFASAKNLLLSAIEIGDTQPKELLPLVAKVLM
jgi:pyrimidine-nucleoside phosphorylase